MHLDVAVSLCSAKTAAKNVYNRFIMTDGFSGQQRTVSNDAPHNTARIYRGFETNAHH